jgi:hypothetical protein
MNMKTEQRGLRPQPKGERCFDWINRMDRIGLRFAHPVDPVDPVKIFSSCEEVGHEWHSA